MEEACGGWERGLTEEIGRPANLLDGFEADEGGNAAAGMVLNSRAYSCEDSMHLHGPQTQNESQRDLRRQIHLQVPHQNHRDRAKGAVNDTDHRRMCICHLGHKVRIQAVRRAGPGDAPEGGWRGALEDDEEEEDQARGDGESHGGPDDVDVGFSDGDAEEEDADGNFKDGGAGDVEEFTDPPVLGVWLAGLKEGVSRGWVSQTLSAMEACSCEISFICLPVPLWIPERTNAMYIAYSTWLKSAHVGAFDLSHLAPFTYHCDHHSRVVGPEALD